MQRIRGFSLIELLVVIAIIGILSAFGDWDNNYYNRGTPCGRLGFIAITMNGTSAGLTSGNFFFINCILAHVNGVIQTKCFYSYSTNATSGYSSLAMPFGIRAGSPNDAALVPEWTLQTIGNSEITSFVTAITPQVSCQ